LRALIDNQRIYYVPDIRVIYTSLFITTMTTRKKVRFRFLVIVLSTHGRDASAHQMFRK